MGCYQKHVQEVISTLMENVQNIKGELVSTIIDQHLTAGRKDVTWSAKDNRGRSVSSGIYFYRLVAGDFVQTKKMVLLK